LSTATKNFVVLENGQKGSGDISGMGDARDVVSNDIVVGGDLDDLEANQVAKEEGAVDKTQGTAGQGAFATFAGPCLTGSVV
jgi:hypothetical protein